MAMENVVLFPHLGSASVYTRDADGPARGRQSFGLGRRQAAADAGSGDAVAAEAARLTAACTRMLVISVMSMGSVASLACWLLAMLALARGAAGACAQAPPKLSDAAKDLVGAWEISNADRDKPLPVTFSVDAGARRLQARARSGLRARPFRR